jgi:hypothetical protein
MKVAIFSQTPVAGAPWLQYHCLSKYTNLKVHHIQQRNKYADGRVFPKDMYISEGRARSWLREADVVHIHNYMSEDLKRLINPRRQKIFATLHSVPRQGNWQALMQYARRTFCIRQPMQLREYSELPSLPNLFDIWDWTPLPNQSFDGKINIVFCPTNKHPNNQLASKGYHTVMPILKRLEGMRDDVGIIHHTSMEYTRNLQLKREGHIVIDDIIGNSWHLTSVEGGSFSQVVLTSSPTELGFPWIHTTFLTLEERLLFYLNNRELAKKKANETRIWLEENWDPKVLVNEYIKSYEA